VINRSIVAYKRVRGLHKGFKRRLEVLKEGRGLRKLILGSPIRVCIYIYKLLVNCTKT
jgi:hypothetical protein